ncbi:Cytoplasmic glyoxalase II [Binucleata daphniae]
MDVVSIQIHEDNFTHIFYDNKNAIVFDPSDPKTVILALQKKFSKNIYHFTEIDNLENIEPRKLLYVFITHHHYDHSAGNQEMLKHCKNVLVYKNSTKKPCHNGTFDDTTTFAHNETKIVPIHTPCHTMDSFCFLVISKVKYLVTGDTLFFLGCGKFFEGTAKDMYNSLNKIKNLDESTICLYGHDYRKNNIKFAEMYWKIDDNIKEKTFLTIRDEKMYNPFLNTYKIDANKCAIDVLAELRNKKNNM